MTSVVWEEIAARCRIIGVMMSDKHKQANDLNDKFGSLSGPPRSKESGRCLRDVPACSSLKFILQLSVMLEFHHRSLLWNQGWGGGFLGHGHTGLFPFPDWLIKRDGLFSWDWHVSFSAKQSLRTSSHGPAHSVTL